MYRITAGAWYPRTTLHLSEIYRLLHEGTSELPLSQSQLTALHKKLNLKFVTEETDYFECVHAVTRDGIELRYYEDGLYTIQITSDDIGQGVKKVEEYMNDCFNPATAYIFSLGAPTPKVLAHFPAAHPVVVTMQKKQWEHVHYDQSLYGEVYAQIESRGITVYKTRSHIFVVYTHNDRAVRELIEMQVFFREFKDQLKRYLNIHRFIWEEISSIKEKKSVSASQLSLLRSKLDGYQKTISLITNRINQMSSYIRTRSKIAKAAHVEDHLNTLFQYKFEALTDTHSYIKEIWKMTGDYIASAIQMIVEVQNLSTQKSIQSLQLITLANVIATLLTKMSADAIPGITQTGVGYVLAIVAAAWGVNTLVIAIFRKIKYPLHFPEHSRL